MAVLGLGIVLLSLLAMDRDLLTAGGASSSRLASCRSLVMILNPAGSTFDISWEGDSDTLGLVKVLYTVSPPGLKPRRRSLTCQFESAGTGSGRRQLVNVVSDGTAIGASRIALLNRFWLRSRDMARPIPGGPPAVPHTINPADAA